MTEKREVLERVIKSDDKHGIERQGIRELPTDPKAKNPLTTPPSNRGDSGKSGSKKR